MKRMLAVAVLIPLTLLSACSSSVSGSGSSGAQVSTPAPSAAGGSPTETGPSAPPSDSAAPSDSAPASTNSTHTTTTHSSAHSHSSHPASSDSAAAGPAQVLNVAYTVHCTSTADTAGTVKLTWQTKGANTVYVLEGLTAGELVGADAKSAGGMGPFAANGSQTLAFACSAGDDYYLVEAYNASDGSHNGVVQQVPFS
jgi:hypothetical protein